MKKGRFRFQTSLRESGLGGLGVGPGQFPSLSAVTSQDDAGSNLPFWSLSCREFFPLEKCIEKSHADIAHGIVGCLGTKEALGQAQDSVSWSSPSYCVWPALRLTMVLGKV